MYYNQTLSINLRLFDGAAGAAGAAAGASAGGEGGAGEAGANAVPNSRRQKATGETVLYGKQTSAVADKGTPEGNPDAGGNKQKPGNDTAPDDATRRATFEKLMGEDYKDLFGERVESIIKRRFKDVKGTEEKLASVSPIMDMLLDKYKITDGDYSKLSKAFENDSSFLEELAEEAGMNVEQYKAYKKMERENQQYTHEKRRAEAERQAEQKYAGWIQQAEQLKKGEFPQLNLAQEVKNPRFVNLLESGVDVKTAYEVTHINDIKTGVAQAAAQTTEKRVVDTIRANASRPAENGTLSNQSGVIIKDDVSKLTRKDRAEAARIARNGGRIEF